MTASTHASISPDSGTHWTEPGAWTVSPGTLRIPLPLPSDGLRAVNVYVLLGHDGLTLVDGGWALDASRDVLERSLASAGLALGDIKRFLVTHAHRDHYTQAVTLRRDVGADVWLGGEERPTIEAIHARPQGPSPQIALLVYAGAPDLAEGWAEFGTRQPVDLSDWELPDRWLADDQLLDVGDRTLTAISTPGHTRGHYVFSDDRAGTLFAGDHVLPTITPSIGFEMDPVPLPLGDFLASLTKVRQLPDRQLLPAHGPIAASTHARIDELLEHHDARLASCRAAVAEEGSSAADVAGVLPWTRHESSLAELDTFNAGLAVLETRAHLDLLVVRGELTRDEIDGVAVYRPVRDRRPLNPSC